jgi:BirA family biotin operon repressor/biotin-[acetyl-CoA-carboxylase] ligase
MYETLFLGKELVQLEMVDSTNLYLKKILEETNKKVEGMLVITQHQTLGRGQMGKVWESEKGMNLTFSLLLKPALQLNNQFLLSKVVSIGIINFLIDLGIKNVCIKWPNDIYVGDNKIAGVLIENTVKGNQIENCIVGIGLNVNQLNFDKEITNATSLKKLLDKKLDKEQLLKQLIFFIERSYLQLKTSKIKEINANYLSFLYRLNETHFYSIGNEKVEAKIIGIAPSGKLQVELNKKVKEFDLQEIKFY